MIIVIIGLIVVIMVIVIVVEVANSKENSNGDDGSQHKEGKPNQAGYVAAKGDAMKSLGSALLVLLRRVTQAVTLTRYPITDLPY